MRCDFCGSPVARWRYPVQGGDVRSACERCRQAIERDDREALLGRILLAPVPRTVPDRYAARLRAEAKRVHAEFWEARTGAAYLADEVGSPRSGPSRGAERDVRRLEKEER